MLQSQVLKGVLLLKVTKALHEYFIIFHAHWPPFPSPTSYYPSSQRRYDATDHILFYDKHGDKQTRHNERRKGKGTGLTGATILTTSLSVSPSLSLSLSLCGGYTYPPPSIEPRKVIYYCKLGKERGWGRSHYVLFTRSRLQTWCQSSIVVSLHVSKREWQKRVSGF
jgi:hypothetical protein